MRTGRSHPTLVMAVQMLVTHADRVALMTRDTGSPHRSPARRTCVIDFTRDHKVLPGSSPAGMPEGSWPRGS